MDKRRYWLIKSEPSDYSFQDLLNEPEQTSEWDGIRNYQARNNIRDEMKVGDGVLFYHSVVKPAAIIGTAVIVKAAATPLGAAAASLYTLFVNAGHGGLDYSAIIKMVRGKADE